MHVGKLPTCLSRQGFSICRLAGNLRTKIIEQEPNPFYDLPDITFQKKKKNSQLNVCLKKFIYSKIYKFEVKQITFFNFI